MTRVTIISNNVGGSNKALREEFESSAAVFAPADIIALQEVPSKKSLIKFVNNIRKYTGREWDGAYFSKSRDNYAFVWAESIQPHGDLVVSHQGRYVAQEFTKNDGEVFCVVNAHMPWKRKKLEPGICVNPAWKLLLEFVGEKIDESAHLFVCIDSNVRRAEVSPLKSDSLGLFWLNVDGIPTTAKGLPIDEIYYSPSVQPIDSELLDRIDHKAWVGKFKLPKPPQPPPKPAVSVRRIERTRKGKTT